MVSGGAEFTVAVHLHYRNFGRLHVQGFTYQRHTDPIPILTQVVLKFFNGFP